MSLFDIIPDAVVDIGEKLKRKRKPEVEEPSALDAVWKQQGEADVARYLARKQTPKRRAVMTFGRFNPPTTGHAVVIDAMKDIAERLGAMPFVFTSVKQDADNPLPYAQKVEWLTRLFDVPVVNNPDVRHPLQALAMLYAAKFDAVTLVVGSDQRTEFERIAKYAGAHDMPNVTVGTAGASRNERVLGTPGMSGTKLRKAARSGNFLAFRRGVPTRNDAVARKLYFQVRKAMGIAKGHAFLLCGFTLNDAKDLRETFGHTYPRVRAFDSRALRLMEQAKPFYMDLSGYGHGQVSSLVRRLTEANYAATIYVQHVPLPKALTEAYVKSATTVGLIKRMPCAVVVEDAACACAHARRTLTEAEGQPKPKEPSEVDRLKLRQKQEVLAQKQRQSNDLLQAKQRELQKRNREDQQKIAQGAKPKSITK